MMLSHGDRLLVGNHHYYIYLDPQISSDTDVTYEDAMKEAHADDL